MKFSHSFCVAAGDIDEQGHVNNVAYLRWIQDIAVAHWRHAASDEMIAKFSWVVIRHEIDYKKQAFENEEITATTWVGECPGIAPLTRIKFSSPFTSITLRLGTVTFSLP